MSLQAKLDMERQCAGVTYGEMAEHFHCTRQNVHQMLHRRISMENFLDVNEFCNFDVVLYSPKGDVRIKITKEDMQEDL